jgi:hypothetical protein
VVGEPQWVPLSEADLRAVGKRTLIVVAVLLPVVLILWGVTSVVFPDRLELDAVGRAESSIYHSYPPRAVEELTCSASDRRTIRCTYMVGSARCSALVIDGGLTRPSCRGGRR